MTLVTGHTEDEALHVFMTWRDLHQHRQALLGEMARVVVARPKGWSQAAQRDVPKMDYGDGCFVCLTRSRRLYWHHVIWVAHGGSNTRHNLVKLCHEHHRGVHPWLPPSTTWEERGFTSVGDIAPHALERLEERWDEPRDGRLTEPHEEPSFEDITADARKRLEEGLA